MLRRAALGALMLVTTLAVGAPLALYQEHRATERSVAELARRLHDEARSREDLARRMSEDRQLIDGSRGQVGELMAALGQLRERHGQQLDHLQQGFQTLATAGTASERILRAYAGGVALLYGTIVFEDPAGRPLRHLVAGVSGELLHLPGGGTPVSLEGEGPVFTSFVVGTGFLVRADGTMLTNRHVVEPSEDGGLSGSMGGSEVVPRVTDLRAFFPGHPDAVRVSLVRVSREADVAVVRGDVEGRAVPVLPLDETGEEAVPGRRVVLLGYPGGLGLLLARAEPAVSGPLVAGAPVGPGMLVERLSREKLIRPYATWGHLADVQPHDLAYDAPTTSGGSGGPILGLSGRVIGINYGLSRTFGSASFGVPIRFALRLLRREAALE